MTPATNETLIHRRVATLRAGEDPSCIARLASGWAILGDPQVLRGYSLLLPDPVVPTLNDLSGEARERFLADMGCLGDALLEITRARRMNYAIFGNVEPALHAHVFPRYDDEPGQLRTAHPFAYDWNAAPRLEAERDSQLLREVRAALERQRQQRP